MRSPRMSLAVAALVSISAGVAVAVTYDGRIGPDLHETGNGRVLHPAGRLTQVGNFPTGAALTPDGRFLWTVSTGRGLNDVRIVSTEDGQVVDTVPLPGSSGGIVMSPTAPVAYVSGVADSTYADQNRGDIQGKNGDVVHKVSYDPATGQAQLAGVYDVPPPAGSPVPQGVADVPGLEGPPQNFPPTNTKRLSWPDRLAVSPDGTRLLVPLNLADHAAVVDTTTGKVSYVGVGHYPYGAAILPDNRTGLVSNEADGTVSVIDLTTAEVTKTITVGPRLSHPETVVVAPDGSRAYVAMTNVDKVVAIDPTAGTVVGEAPLTDATHPNGVSPVGMSLDALHHRLYVAEEGLDDLAVLDVSQDTPTLAGRIPTASFPVNVATHTGNCAPQGDCTTVAWLSAKGFGVGPNPTGPNPTSPLNSDNHINSFTYLPSIVRGMTGVLQAPTDARLAQLTAVAAQQALPADQEAAPADTPLRPDGPIKHVFFVVRENRTYDQILGDVPQGDGDPSLELFPSDVTPNAHAFTQRFPLLDHVYANSEASIDGHFWTSAGDVSDYVQKNWMQNYGGRGRPYDFGVYSVTWPGNGFLFDQAERQGISYFNYGEAIAGTVPLTDKDRDPAMTAEVVRKFANSDLGANTPNAPAGECYPNDASIEHDAITGSTVYDGTPPAGADPKSESRFECFKQRFESQVATGTVPSFNYLVLPNDHTVGTSPGKRTPQSMVADNDYGLGEIVDEISHSSIWDSSAIFVVEDDSQDGADHVDAHRIPAFAISPYAVRGTVSHRYDFASVLRSMELILGMEPLSLFDANAVPMYDAFSSTPVNSDPYTALVPSYDRTTTNTARSADAALSAKLDFRHLDEVPQRTLDRILWHAVHGADSTPPAPGPNAQPERDGDD